MRIPFPLLRYRWCLRRLEARKVCHQEALHRWAQDQPREVHELPYTLYVAYPRTRP